MARERQVDEFAPEILGPSFDTLGGAVQQPGTIRRSEHTTPPDILHNQDRPPMPTQQRASDKFAVVTLTAAVDRAYQLLPADYRRKSAAISCFGFPCYVGDESSIANILNLYTSTGALQAPGVFQIPLLTSLTYTSKQGLYVCSAGGAGNPSQVQCMVERYDTGTPIT